MFRNSPRRHGDYRTWQPTVWCSWRSDKTSAGSTRSEGRSLECGLLATTFLSYAVGSCVANVISSYLFEWYVGDSVTEVLSGVKRRLR